MIISDFKEVLEKFQDVEIQYTTIQRVFDVSTALQLFRDREVVRFKYTSNYKRPFIEMR